MSLFVFTDVSRFELPVTPAMEAGVADHVWTLAEVVGLLDSREGMSATPANVLLSNHAATRE